METARLGSNENISKVSLDKFLYFLSKWLTLILKNTIEKLW